MNRPQTIREEYPYAIRTEKGRNVGLFMFQEDRDFCFKEMCIGWPSAKLVRVNRTSKR